MSTLSTVLWASLYLLAIVVVWAVIAAIMLVVVYTIRQGPQSQVSRAQARSLSKRDTLAVQMQDGTGWALWESQLIADALLIAANDGIAPDAVRAAIEGVH